jgi:hypothetical protein
VLQHILQVLEKNIMDRDLIEDLTAEKHDIPILKESMSRIEQNQYETMEVGDFAARAKERTAERERKRALYEVSIYLHGCCLVTQCAS